jgi:uncharacterized membrane protein
MSLTFDVVLAAFLSAIHVLTLALGLGAVFLRGRALAALPAGDDAAWKRLLAADSAWGVAAALWIITGFGRVFSGGKDPEFYWRNGFFWVKLGLFLVIFALELRPMITFIRVRQARARHTPIPAFDAASYYRTNHAQLALAALIPFVAALMARGVWLF